MNIFGAVGGKWNTLSFTEFCNRFHPDLDCTTPLKFRDPNEVNTFRLRVHDISD